SGQVKAASFMAEESPMNWEFDCKSVASAKAAYQQLVNKYHFKPLQNLYMKGKKIVVLGVKGSDIEPAVNEFAAGGIITRHPTATGAFGTMREAGGAGAGVEPRAFAAHEKTGPIP